MQKLFRSRVCSVFVLHEGAGPSLSSAEIMRERFWGLVKDRRRNITARNEIQEVRTDPSSAISQSVFEM